VSRIIFGIDPGSVVSGYGAVCEKNGRLICIDAGVVKTPSKLAFPRRLQEIYEGLTEAIERVGPDEAAVESVFHARNAATALKLGQARGVALLAAVRAGLEIHEYAPASVKQAVTGSGRADKKQVKMMVETLLNQRFDLPEDATDALAVAICHLHASPLLDRLASAGVRGRR
jgi:crossover junction endodeoxyribonuclease RuvC